MQIIGFQIVVVTSLVSLCYSDGKVGLFVAISAGLPRSQRHIREIAVHFSNLNRSLVNEGELVVARDAEFQSLLGRFRLYDNIEDDENPREGRIFTGYSIPQTNFSAIKVPSDCIGYFVRLEWKRQTVAQSCLQVHANWMADLLNRHRSFGNLTLNSLAIPGTHNAGAYKAYDPPTESTFTWYRDCQEEDVYSQLVYGSRFIDIRPGVVKLNNTRKYWVFHSVFRTDNLLETVLKDIRRFLDEHKQEVIFVDFHEFPWGFKSPSDYSILGDFVESILGPYMLQYRPHMITVAEAIALNQRAVVTFDRDDALARRFLSGVNHAWANTDNLDILQIRLTSMQTHKSEGNRLYSAMAQVTPQGGLSVFFDKYQGGVRGISHRTNPKVMSWWRNEEALRHTTNIVAVDYLTSTDVVNICMEINAERAINLSNHRVY